ncbi:MAG: hypothetical protein GSR79_09850 [Desulfurococcales archaeon]|nr:hypothetical protein [Desulfurococcales archaeon]
MDAGLYRDFVGVDPSGVLLNHAEQNGLIVRRGLLGVEEFLGTQFPSEEVLEELESGVKGKLLALTGMGNVSGVRVWLCSDVVSAASRVTQRGVVFEPVDSPRVPYRRGELYGYISVVEGLSGRYRPELDCTRKACVVDASLATGVRRYPRIEGEFLVFSLLDRWLYTPGGSGVVFVSDGFPDPPECNAPSPLILAYLWGVLSYLESIGYGEVERRVLGLSGEYGWLLDRAGYTPLTPPEESFRAGVLSVSLPLPAGEIGVVKRRLLEKGVRVGFVRKIMRLSPSFYNEPGDIDLVLRVLP